jgi:glycosyltransferase involved in cell wall biosynthesis
MIERFVVEQKPALNQLIYVRAVSVHAIFKRLSPGDLQDLPAEFTEAIKGSAKRFPKIGTFSSDSEDNIRFEPLQNRNLVNIVLPCLQKLLWLIGQNPKDWSADELEKSVARESRIFEDELARLNAIVDKVPDIISKELRPEKDRKTPDKPKVSIITTSMNLASLVEETIRSVKNQDYDSIEYIIIDGVSTDGSLDIIKKHPNIVLLSEKDTGYPDAFWKGLRLAKGDYILQCCISDSYASTAWVRRCAEILDDDPSLSLVWGMSCSLDNDSKMSAFSNPQFHYNEAPRKEAMFDYWIRTYRFQPEVNLCVRKSVLMKCYPKLEECNEDILDWLEFAYRFNSSGYISAHLPMLANFYHVNHGNQLGKKIDKGGRYAKNFSNYKKKIIRYRRQLILGLKKHIFKDHLGNNLDVDLDIRRLRREYVYDKISRIFRPMTYINYLKRMAR